MNRNFQSNIYKKLEGFGNEINMWSVDLFLEEMVSNMGLIDDVIEIGHCNGISTLILAEYSKRVFTFDVAVRNQELVWSHFPEHRKRIAVCISQQRIIDFTIQEIADWRENRGLNFDLAFIDGDHSEKGVQHDFNLVRKLGCNRIIFHDANRFETLGLMKRLGVKQVSPDGVYGYLEL